MGAEAEWKDLAHHADELAAVGKYEEALAKYDEALAKYEDALRERAASRPSRVRQEIDEVRGADRVSAELQAKKAWMHYRLGQYRQACRCYEEAAEYWRDRIERLVPQAQRLHRIAQVYSERGEYRRAAQVYAQIAAAQHRVSAKDDVDKTTKKRLEALLCVHLGDYDRAVTLYEEIRQQLRKNGSSHAEEKLERAAILSELATAHAESGHPQKAKALYGDVLGIYKHIMTAADVPHASTQAAREEALRNNEAVAGDSKSDSASILKDPLQYADALYQLAHLEATLGHHTDALKRLEDAKKRLEETSGKDHPDVARTLHAMGQVRVAMEGYDEALAHLMEALSIWEAVGDEANPERAATLLALAEVLEQQGDYEGALERLEEVAAIHVDTTGRKHADYAETIARMARICRRLGRYRRALELYRELAAIQLEFTGGRSAEYIETLWRMGETRELLGEFGRAVCLYQEALRLLDGVERRSEDQRVWRLRAELLDSAARVYRRLGADMKSLRAYEEVASLGLQRSTSDGEKDWAMAVRSRAMAGMAATYIQVGNLGRALDLYRRAVELQAIGKGENHPDYARTLCAMADVLERLGDYLKASRCYEVAIRILGGAVGAARLDLAWAQAALARLRLLEQSSAAEHERPKGECENGQKGPLRAEKLAQAALNIVEEYQRYVWSLQDQRRRLLLSARLRWVLSRCLSVRIALRAPADALYAVVWNWKRTALQEEALGRALRWEPELKEVMRELEGVTSWLRRLRGRGRSSSGEKDGEVKDERGTRKGATRRARGTDDEVKDEIEEELTARRGRLAWDALSAARRADPKPRGASRGRQWDPRRAAEDLVRARSSQAALALAEDPVDEKMRKLRKEREEALETRVKEARNCLAESNPECQKLWRKEEWNALGEVLAPGSVFVEFFVFEQDVVETSRIGQENRRVLRSEPRLLAFVVRKQVQGNEPKVELLKLGSVRELSRLVTQWRKGLDSVKDAQGATGGVVDGETSRNGGGEKQAFEAWKQLERLVGDPLRKRTQGAKVLFVAPDGPICRMPLAALRGWNKRYLIEELPIVYVLSGPHLLEVLRQAELNITFVRDVVGGMKDRLRERRGAESANGGVEQTDVDVIELPRRRPVRGLLVVGGVQYEWNSGIARTREASRKKASPHDRRVWEALPGTIKEAEEITQLYRQVLRGTRLLRLTGLQATKAALIRALDGGRWRYVHLATHGFYRQPEEVEGWKLAMGEPVSDTAVVGECQFLGGSAPALLEAMGSATEMDAATAVYDPLQFSALVLGSEERDWEELTAAEVRELDLRDTQLVVLSACETGLGEIADGEGAMGLHRAFHAAGAATVLASLWKVGDAATSLLMETFYKELWGKGRNPAEALQKAQVALLSRPEQVQKRERELEQWLEQRGLRPKGAETDRGGTPNIGQLRDWAAFIISGGW